MAPPTIRLRIDLNEGGCQAPPYVHFAGLSPWTLSSQSNRYVSVTWTSYRAFAWRRVPIAANQSGWTSREVLNIIAKRAVDVVVTDAHQEGGINGFRQTIDLCEIAGLPVVYHAFTTLTIGMTASMHVMCSRPNCFQMAHQTYPPGFMKEDIVTEMIDTSSGSARVPLKPGLGLELDTDKSRGLRSGFERTGAYPLFSPNAEHVWVPMG